MATIIIIPETREPVPCHRIEGTDDVVMGDLTVRLIRQNDLRFVIRDNKRILQQAWMASIGVEGFWAQYYTEWRDVPLVEE